MTKKILNDIKKDWPIIAIIVLTFIVGLSLRIIFIIFLPPLIQTILGCVQMAS